MLRFPPGVEGRLLLPPAALLLLVVLMLEVLLALGVGVGVEALLLPSFPGGVETRLCELTLGVRRAPMNSMSKLRGVRGDWEAGVC